ncbi:hypothetical protein F4703DRAFT_1940225 [Phycomyces blakesleeanus]|uniref:Uncharacterized protein n=1 Tax=Phycomyces blakesleeanus (strain ATCC 8743b / DSM 1359 / FGSC 10004 / NBRC 33097 / NRRL 1555) TaxID=763407 RepID=A0A162PZJ4_PHYB8|nr:hypothetical protein PHYBLDRAFT_141346 [Phycomyces blakesleeanus NRRL 1555(-)]OAD77457.1 hypothetical protein PHYBLDRAFT_141346 [Phycomyces blakesleeanus NRRL 1555(-)]|eukprot:XP_018295497.1 hypothetical protein PHYBLDRAFT_141346 [Phycomyces blakesleeanus NRRL 1555(-)]
MILSRLNKKHVPVEVYPLVTVVSVCVLGGIGSMVRKFWTDPDIRHKSSS